MNLPTANNFEKPFLSVRGTTSVDLRTPTRAPQPPPTQRGPKQSRPAPVHRRGKRPSESDAEPIRHRTARIWFHPDPPTRDAGADPRYTVGDCASHRPQQRHFLSFASFLSFVQHNVRNKREKRRTPSVPPDGTPRRFSPLVSNRKRSGEFELNRSVFCGVICDFRFRPEAPSAPGCVRWGRGERRRGAWQGSSVLPGCRRRRPGWN